MKFHKRTVRQLADMICGNFDVKDSFFNCRCSSALTRFFEAQNSRPILRFVLINQLIQVYFPSELVYRDADGSVQKAEADADLDAVRRLIELLLKFTREDVPSFQLFVTVHAILREQWFQDSLVRQPWTKPPAPVPEDWPLETTNLSCTLRRPER